MIFLTVRTVIAIKKTIKSKLKFVRFGDFLDPFTIPTLFWGLVYVETIIEVSALWHFLI